jgi:hypothetical protein
LRLYSAVTATTALTITSKRGRIEYGHLIVELDGVLVCTGIEDVARQFLESTSSVICAHRLTYPALARNRYI